MEAYHIAVSFLERLVLEQACPYTWRAPRILLIIAVIQEHAREAQSFWIGRTGWGPCTFLGASIAASIPTCWDPQQEDLAFILLYKREPGTHFWLSVTLTRLWPI
jgi:hypothetical protein